MAKWGGGYLWGGGTLWGEGQMGVIPDAFTGEVVWILNIDWTGNKPINEASRLRDYDLFRGRKHYVNPDGSGFEKIQPGTLNLVLDNSDGRYSTYNTESPLYGHILPGRKIQALVYSVATKRVYPRFTGFITDIQPSDDMREVSISAEDGLRRIADADYSSSVVYATDISSAIDKVLSFVNWTYPRLIQSTDQPLQVFEPGSGSPLDIIQDLAEANLGAFFIEKNGFAMFSSIKYPSMTTHTIDQSQILRDPRFPQPWETVRNKIRIKANRRGRRPASIVWALAGIEEFSAGQIKTFGASFKTSDSLAVETLVANSMRDGSGTNLADSFTVNVTSVSSEASNINVTYNGSGTAYLLSLRLAGSEIVSVPDTKFDFDQDSIDKYGPRLLEIDNPWLQDSNYAAAYVTMLKNHLKDPYKDPVIQIDQYPDLMYLIDLYDRVHFTAAKFGIDETYTVAGIGEKWKSDTGQSVVQTLYLQHVLYDDTEITPNPFEPGNLPLVPDPESPVWLDPYIPENNIPIIDPYPDPDTSNSCLRTDADIIPGVPVTFTNAKLKNDTNNTFEMESFIWYPCTLRAKNSINKSTLTIWGGWSYWTDAGIQTYDIYAPWFHIDAILADKSVVVSGTLDNPELQTSPRRWQFLPDAAVEIAGFRIWIDKNNVYSPGDQIGAGDIDVKDSSGVSVSGLTIGDYYSIEGNGGPNYAGPSFPSPLYKIDLNVGLGWQYIGGMGGTTYSNGSIGKGILAIDSRIRTNYSRGYFKALNTTAAVRVAGNSDDPPEWWDDNFGTMAYILRRSRNAGRKSMVIDQASLKNICGSGIL